VYRLGDPKEFTMHNATKLLTAASLAATPFALFAQSGAMEGSVSTDSLGKHSLPGVEISIPALNLMTRTNFAGEYRLRGIAPGRYLAIATAVGYRSVGDTVTVTAGEGNFHDFVLAMKATVLDSVVSKAAAPLPQHISPGLNGFEERMHDRKGGYFVPESIFRKEEDRPLADVIVAHVPGIIVLRTAGSKAYLATGRGPSAGAMSGKSVSCYPDVYLDGVMLAPLPDPVRPIKAVDLSQFPPTELGAMEFYPGGASLPIQFNPTAAGCGALLLWTREK
jgi:hypothetical protein